MGNHSVAVAKYGAGMRGRDAPREASTAPCPNSELLQARTVCSLLFSQFSFLKLARSLHKPWPPCLCGVGCCSVQEVVQDSFEMRMLSLQV